jgi:ABC-type transport system involved in cytochrome c biogenesis ATPase subunit
MTLSDSPQTVPLLLARALRCSAGPQRLWGPMDVQLTAGVTWVTGGEGRGKTSLLRMLAGDLVVPGSHLQLAGTGLQTEPAQYRQKAFWMDPRTSAWDQSSPLQFWEQGKRQWPLWNAEVCRALATTLGLDEHLAKPLYMLSTGSKRKVWITAACASGAELTCMDEPFAALDKASIRAITGLLEEAASGSSRAWVVADYEPPAGVPLAATIDLGE